MNSDSPNGGLPTTEGPEWGIARGVDLVSIDPARLARIAA